MSNKYVVHAALGFLTFITLSNVTQRYLTLSNVKYPFSTNIRMLEKIHFNSFVVLCLN
jgi:hypothetical protein